jgi:hypothetical protein
MELFFAIRLTRKVKNLRNATILKEKKKEEQTGPDKIYVVGSDK